MSKLLLLSTPILFLNFAYGSNLKSAEVSVQGREVTLNVHAFVCTGRFPTINHKVSKISETAVAVEFSVDPRRPQTNCSNLIGFVVPVSSDIEGLGLDPLETDIFVQLR